MQSLPNPINLQAFVKEVFVMKNEDASKETHMPFYADGFPGIMYSKTSEGVILHPGNKRLSPFFLFGQTIHPIVLSIKGAYQCVVFQLYPFAARLLLGIDPKVLNDDCFDLRQLTQVHTQDTLNLLEREHSAELQAEIITRFLDELVKHASTQPDQRIQLAVNLILSTKGTLSVRKLRDQLAIGERSFERHFSKEIGVSPKQFARIIQFHASLSQLSEQDYLTLTDVSYANGYADQSHFIRTFKRYAGKTPKEYLREVE